MTPFSRLRTPALVASAILALATGLGACGDEDEPGADQGAQAPASGDKEAGEGKPTLAVKVRHGEPVGGPKKVEVKKDEQVKITVSSDARGRLHLHGYETYEEVAPGKKAVFDFKADIEGLFDLELEGTGTELAELEVSP